LREELYRAKVAGVFGGTTGLSLSYELLRRITAESHEFCVGCEVIRSIWRKSAAEKKTGLLEKEKEKEEEKKEKKENDDDDDYPETTREY
jgi:hypothetical protein